MKSTASVREKMDLKHEDQLIFFFFFFGSNFFFFNALHTGIKKDKVFKLIVGSREKSVKALNNMELQ